MARILKETVIQVPGQRVGLAPVGRDRVRALKQHLIETLRDLAGARRPERLIQKRTAEPTGWTGVIVREACAHCAGSCCMAGGTHAFIDERTLARVRAERPGLTDLGLIKAYARAVPDRVVSGSCVFHGARGCALDRDLRAELCNSYYCNGLLEVLKAPPKPGVAIAIQTHAGERKSLTETTG